MVSQSWAFSLLGIGLSDFQKNQTNKNSEWMGDIAL